MEDEFQNSTLQERQATHHKICKRCLATLRTSLPPSDVDILVEYWSLCLCVLTDVLRMRIVLSITNITKDRLHVCTPYRLQGGAEMIITARENIKTPFNEGW